MTPSCMKVDVRHNGRERGGGITVWWLGTGQEVVPSFIWPLYCIQAPSLLSMPFLFVVLPLIYTALVVLLSCVLWQRYCSCHASWWRWEGVARQTLTTAHDTQGFLIEASCKGGILGGMHYSFPDVVMMLWGCWTIELHDFIELLLSDEGGWEQLWT